MDVDSRKMEFLCYRVYDMKRFTVNPKTDAFVVGNHLQKMVDTHTLCGYKTDVTKPRGRWTFTSLGYFADEPDERDTMCFRCLRIWALKNRLQFPTRWMVDRINTKESKKVERRDEKDE